MQAAQQRWSVYLLGCYLDGAWDASLCVMRFTLVGEGKNYLTSYTLAARASRFCCTRYSSLRCDVHPVPCFFLLLVPAHTIKNRKYTRLRSHPLGRTSVLSVYAYHDLIRDMSQVGLIPREKHSAELRKKVFSQHALAWIFCRKLNCIWIQRITTFARVHECGLGNDTVIDPNELLLSGSLDTRVDRTTALFGWIGAIVIWVVWSWMLDVLLQWSLYGWQTSGYFVSDSCHSHSRTSMTVCTMKTLQRFRDVFYLLCCWHSEIPSYCQLWTLWADALVDVLLNAFVDVLVDGLVDVLISTLAIPW